MPVYEYKAANEEGKTVKGVLTAESEEELEASLENRNLYLISAKLTNKSAPSTAGAAAPAAGRRVARARVSRGELISFTVHLATVIGAGVPILQGLEDMIEETENPHFQNVIRDIRQQIEEGSSISEAFARHPEVFRTFARHSAE